MPANVQTMFSVREQPWHKLGRILQDAPDSKTAIKEAGLDWEVTLQPLFTRIAARGKESRLVELPNKHAVVRYDNGAILGTVGRLFRPLQNARAFEVLDGLVASRGAHYETAGALGIGERIWALLSIPGHIGIRGTQDEIKKFLLLSNAHDGSARVRIMLTPVRVVCQNTLTLALSKKGGCSIRHTELNLIPEQFQKIREKIGIYIKAGFEEFDEAANLLASVELSSKALKKYLNDVFNVEEKRKREADARNRFQPAPGKKILSAEDISDEELPLQTRKTLERVEELFEERTNSVRGSKRTAWSAYNAITEFVDHERLVRGEDIDPTARLSSMWFGTGADLKRSALQKALALVGSGGSRKRN